MATLMPVSVMVSMQLDATAMAAEAVARARAMADAPLPAPGASDPLLEQALLAMTRDSQAQAASLQQRTREALPDGVTLLEMSYDQRGAQVRSVLRFQLVDLKLLPKVAVATGTGPEELAHPFADFKVTRGKSGVEVRGCSPSMLAPPDAHGTMRFELETTMPAKQHTATRAQGGLLVWEAALGAPALEVSATYPRP